MNNLKPSEIWYYFNEILKIPRLSKNEGQILEYLRQFAKQYNLTCAEDKVGNCLIIKPACKGYEDRETIILQSHIDMVGEKLLEVNHDFTKDPITAFEKDGWISAEGTTLGADDGIGIAASLAVLAADDIKHGRLEVLFTVDEETGMTGAFGLQEGFLSGKILLNLDSEDEGEIYIGCAGGIDTIVRFKKEYTTLPQKPIAIEFVLEGLQGGHSGDEIHKSFGNSIKLMNRMLWNMDQRELINLASFTGGKLRNAIPRDANAVVIVEEEKLEALKMYFASFLTEVSNELRNLEPGFKMSLEEVDLPSRCFTKNFQKQILNSIYACPHGLIAWSQQIPGLVETSTNLAVIKDINDEYIEIVTSQRSSVDSAKKDIADRVTALFSLANGEVRHSGGYPGWKPNKDSKILKISEKVYKKLFKDTPEIKAIHAGLECGLFLEKYPDLDMISFGPTIKGAHTPEERIEIKSVLKFWDFLLEMLKNAPLK